MNDLQAVSLDFRRRPILALGEEALSPAGRERVRLLSASTTKKVSVRCFDERLIHGYVSPHTYLRHDSIELLDRRAQLQIIPYVEVRTVSFVREFEDEPDENRRKVFGARPKSDGLWVRLILRDGEILEGIIPNNLLQLNERGITVTPPDPNANTQRVFVPRAALSELKVLGVIGSPVRPAKRARPAPAPARDQMDLFNSPAPSE